MKQGLDNLLQPTFSANVIVVCSNQSSILPQTNQYLSLVHRYKHILQYESHLYRHSIEVSYNYHTDLFDRRFCTCKPNCNFAFYQLCRLASNPFASNNRIGEPVLQMAQMLQIVTSWSD